jgi:hypothetical protein
VAKEGSIGGIYKGMNGDKTMAESPDTFCGSIRARQVEGRSVR